MNELSRKPDSFHYRLMYENKGFWNNKTINWLSRSRVYRQGSNAKWKGVVMKRRWISIIILVLALVCSGCSRNKAEEGKRPEGISPTSQPLATLPAEVTPEADDTKADGEDLPRVEDYYPMEADTEYIYEGEGNEYAGYYRYVDYIDPVKNRIQIRTNNGGSETVQVLERKNGSLAVTYLVNECYYRENFMERTAPEGAQVLLQEPLVKGTSWTVSGSTTRYISGTEVPVSTPYGSFQALEVTTKGEDSVTRDYYAIGVGLVKSIYESEGLTVSQSLKDLKRDMAFKQTASIYHADVDEKIYMEQVELTLPTNTDSLTVLAAAMKEVPAKQTYLPLISKNTEINHITLEEDGILRVDFSKEFVEEMNAGSGYELLILQSITNTLGGYYGASKVLITLEGKPYESGHILMEKGEVFEVDYSGVSEE